MKSSVFISCALFAAALLCGLSITGCDRPSPTAPSALPEVATLQVIPREVTLTTELPGRTAAFLVAEIRPQANGLVRKRLFEEGTEVAAGQVLYQIEPAPFQAALDNAQAALGKVEAGLPAARARAERFREALILNAVSRQDCDDAEAALKQTEAEIQYWKATVHTARINLQYTQVLAPISGRIGRSSVSDGAIVTAYQPAALATIQQLDPIYVDVPQSTAELLRLQRRFQDGRIHNDAKNHKKVRLILEDGTPYPLEGTLQFRDVSVDPTTGSVILRMVFENPNGVLLPGMFVRALIHEGLHKHAVLIPQQAVTRDPKGNPVALIVDDSDRVEQRTLNLDRAIGDQWLVASGLTPGDHVIIEGMQKVRPGDAVMEVPIEADRERASQAAGTTQSAPAVD